MTDRKYFSGNSLEQAVMNAARHFKVDPDDLDYRQLDKRHGFVKVRRSHLIEVDPNSPRKPLSDDEAYKRAMSMDPEAHLGRDPNDRSYVTDDKQQGGRGRSRGRRGRSKPRKPPRDERRQGKQRESKPEARRDRGGHSGNGRQRRPDQRRREESKGAESGNGRRAQPDRGPQTRERDSSEGRRRVMRPAGRGGRKVAEGPAAEVALEGAASVLRLAALDLRAEAYQGDDHLTIELSGADEERVTRQRGEVLAALQQLVPSIVRSRTGERIFCRVDCDGFREIHEERLRDLAQRVAGKVDRSQRAQVLESMNPAERRIIHMTLNDDPSVSTESLGRGYFKRVRISPE